MNGAAQNARVGCIVEVKDFIFQTTPLLIHSKYCVSENTSFKITAA